MFFIFFTVKSPFHPDHLKDLNLNYPHQNSSFYPGNKNFKNEAYETQKKFINFFHSFKHLEKKVHI